MKEKIELLLKAAVEQGFEQPSLPFCLVKITRGFSRDKISFLEALVRANFKDDENKDELISNGYELVRNALKTTADEEIPLFLTTMFGKVIGDETSLNQAKSIFDDLVADMRLEAEKVAELYRVVDNYSIDGLRVFEASHVTDMSYDIPSNTYTITCMKPGIIIGYQGETLKSIEELVGAKIIVKERRFV